MANLVEGGKPTLVHSVDAKAIRQYDLVELRGGPSMMSPIMIVELIVEGTANYRATANVMWFDEHASLQRETMPLDMLVKHDFDLNEIVGVNVLSDLNLTDVMSVGKVMEEALAYWRSSVDHDVASPKWVNEAERLLMILP